jgi:hypothetical protein
MGNDQSHDRTGSIIYAVVGRGSNIHEVECLRAGEYQPS